MSLAMQKPKHNKFESESKDDNEAPDGDVALMVGKGAINGEVKSFTTLNVKSPNGDVKSFTTFNVKTPNGDIIPVVKQNHVDEEHFRKVQKCLKFKQFVESLDTKVIEVSQIMVRDIFMFGPNVGFILTDTKAKLRANGAKLSGVTFIRGKAVVSFLLLRSKQTGNLFIVLTDQFRVPTGAFRLEAVAGMCDEETNSKRVTKAETGEEVGISVEEKNLHLLGDFYPSHGGCDELIDIYEGIVEMDQETIDSLNGSNKGFLLDDRRKIRARVLPFTVENILATRDSKAIVGCMYLLHRYGLLPKGKIHIELPDGNVPERVNGDEQLALLA